MDWLAAQSLADLENAVISLRAAITDGQDVGGRMARWLKIYELLLEIKREYQ